MLAIARSGTIDNRAYRLALDKLKWWKFKIIMMCWLLTVEPFHAWHAVPNPENATAFIVMRKSRRAGWLAGWCEAGKQYTYQKCVVSQMKSSKTSPRDDQILRSPVHCGCCAKSSKNSIHEIRKTHTIPITDVLRHQQWDKWLISSKCMENEDGVDRWKLDAIQSFITLYLPRALRRSVSGILKIAFVAIRRYAMKWWA